MRFLLQLIDNKYIISFILLVISFSDNPPPIFYKEIAIVIALADDKEFSLSVDVFAGSIEGQRRWSAQRFRRASLLENAMTGRYFVASKQSFKAFDLSGSRMALTVFIASFGRMTISPIWAPRSPSPTIQKTENTL